MVWKINKAAVSTSMVLQRETVFSFMNQQRIAFLPTAEKVQLADRSGKPIDYWRYEFRRTFTAKRIGRIGFGPASLKGEFATEVKDGHVLGESVYAVAKPAVIDVQDVPRDGRPECYIDAVGKFQLSATLEPKRAKTGDPMTLTVSLEGEGTLDSANAARLEKTAGHRRPLQDLRRHGTDQGQSAAVHVQRSADGRGVA